MQNKLVQLINVCLEKNIPFVSFRLPYESKLQTWLELSGKLNFVEHFHEVASQSGFVYAPFHRRTNFPIVFFEPELIFENDIIEDSFLKKLSDRDPLYPEYSIEEPVEIDKNVYLRQVNSFIRSFDNTFTKAVLSRVHVESKQSHFEAGSFFIKMTESYLNAFCHLINIPGAGIWTGASPETLLQVENEIVKTVSLAGTKAGKKVHWSNKEIDEQKIVTDYIEDIFRKQGIENFSKEEVQDQQAGDLVHLATKFSFNSKYIKNNLAEFLSELHPTPAVCGLPKENALELIFQTEKHNREYYTGFCGPLNMNLKTDLFMNIRCMKILPEKLSLFVGGGITSKSDPVKEWEETLLKTKTVLSQL